jgi:hypothetical protein
MPSISVNAPHVLYVESMLDEQQRFLQQCETIKQWQTRRLTAYDLLGLSPRFTKQDFKRAKMKMFLHFHPDKNSSDSLNADAAFKVLKDAAEYLDFYEQSDRSDDSTVCNNPFYPKRMGISTSSKKAPVRKFPAQQEYERRLVSVYNTQSISSDDEAFFRDTITKHPEYLSLSLHETNGCNLFNVVCECGGNSSFFQWLTSQPYAEETLLKFNQGGWNCFCSAMHFGRRDCLRFLFDTYGMEVFQAAGIDDGLPLLVVEDEQLPILDFLFNELGYAPKTSYDMGRVLCATFQYIEAKVDLFKKLYRTFVVRTWLIDSQGVFSTAVNDGKLSILTTMHEEGMINPDTALPVFKNASDFNLFLAKPSSTEVIAFLKSTGYKKIYKLDSPGYLIQLLDLNIISVEELLQQYPTSSDIWGSEPLITTIVSKDRAKFKAWLAQCPFHDCFQAQPGYTKDSMEHRFLGIMNKEKWSFQLEQVAYIQERWDSVWRTIAENPVTLGRDYRETLDHLIESIARCPNPAPHLKKLYNIPVELSLQHEDSVQTLHFASFTPLQLLLALNETAPAIRLIKSGFVDSRQEVQYTESLYVDGVYVSLDTPRRMSIIDFARIHNLAEVEKAIQLCEAEAYLYQRALERNYKTQCSFFGFFNIHFGFSKQEKITAARALISYLKNKVPIPESCRPALSQGELGKVAALNGVEYMVLQQAVPNRAI